VGAPRPRGRPPGGRGATPTTPGGLTFGPPKSERSRRKIALDAQTSHRLTYYRLSIAEPSRGSVARTISEIAGLSLDVADGPIEHTAADFRRFAEGVIEVNGLVLEPRRGSWTARSVEAFPDSVVVGFAGTVDPQSSLDFLFDRRGNLLEIDETRPLRR
jgi:hypothetical protein